MEKDDDKICSNCKKLYPYPNNIDIKEFFAPISFYIKGICILGYYHCISKSIKQYKFNENIYIGKQLSLLLCEKLSMHPWINNIDYIIPIPLHPIKKRKRGFNQSKFISDIIARQFNKKVVYNNLIRCVYNSDQYGSNQEKRVENVRGIFKVINPSELENKNILIVDDVITSCSTVKECCKEIIKSKNVNIYIACLASDRHII
ncbi:MAG: ComF family protein [Bacteroidales bacterium]